MIVECPISLGELIDKISILFIKKRYIEDINKKKYIIEELDLLEKNLNDSLGENEEVNQYLEKLINTNLKLWKIEDQIRE